MGQNFISLGDRGPLERGEEKTAPLEKTLFYRYWLV